MPVNIFVIQIRIRYCCSTRTTKSVLTRAALATVHPIEVVDPVLQCRQHKPPVLWLHQPHSPPVLLWCSVARRLVSCDSLVQLNSFFVRRGRLLACHFGGARAITIYIIISSHFFYLIYVHMP